MNVRRIIVLFLVACGGAAVGSVLRQTAAARASGTGERPEIVVAIDLKAVAVGTLAGAATGRFGPVTAFFAAANAVTTGLTQRLGVRGGDATT